MVPMNIHSPSARLAPRIEPLEARIAPATLIALTDTNSLLRFHDATPGTATTTAVSGLFGAAGETLVGIDFRPADGLLYGVTKDNANAGRLYTIVPTSGAATLVGLLAAAVGDDNPYTALDGTRFAVDFGPMTDRLRVLSDNGQNLRVVPGTAAVFTDTDVTTAGADLIAGTYTNNFPGTPFTDLYVIDDATDSLYTQQPAASGNLFLVGSLGVTINGDGGFDIGLSNNESFAALTAGGITGLYRISLTTGAASSLGAIGAGTTPLRDLAVVQHTWDGDGGNANWSNAANWVAGIVPRAGDSVLFPAGPANKTINYDLGAPLPIHNSARFTGADYVIGGIPIAFDGGIATHAAGTNRFDALVRFDTGTSAGVDELIAEQAASVLDFNGGLLANTGAGRGIDFLGDGTIRIGQIGMQTAGNATPINFNVGTAIIDGFVNTGADAVILSGDVIVNQALFTRVLLQGGTISGPNTIRSFVGTGGTVLSGAQSLAIGGDFSADAATTLRFDIEASGFLDPLSVAQSLFGGPSALVTLTNTALVVNATNGSPAQFPLLLNDGTEAITGTFAGLPEGATVMVGTQTYAISYAGGDGNDIVLTRTGGPAPTIAANGKSATWIDVDGDTATVTITAGTLTPGNFLMRDVGLGRAQFEILDFKRDTQFAGTNITFTARPTSGTGDGNVNVGGINAAGLDLGNVKLPGDLAFIDAGDATGATAAVKSLTVHSFGVFGLSTGAADLFSNIRGGVGKLTIRGDVHEAHIRVEDPDETESTSVDDGEATIKSLVVGGSIIGGAADFSGRIEARDKILSSKINGSIIGGSGIGSGVLSAVYDLGSVTLAGSLLGGSASFNTGQIESVLGGAKSIRIAGNIDGGGGEGGNIDIDDNLGTLFIGGSVFGGTGNGAGIHAENIGTLTIVGSLIGGGSGSSQIDVDDTIGSFTIGGSVIGGGQSSAQIDAEVINKFTIGGSLIGGAGNFTAQIDVDDMIGSLSIRGSVIGGVGDFSAQIDSDLIKSLTIGGGLVGGEGDFSVQIDADRIDKLTIGGSAAAGAGMESVQIVAGTDGIGSVKVGGNLMGGPGANSGIIRTQGGLGALTIGGSVFAGTGTGSGRIAIQDDAGTIKIGGGIFGTTANPAFITVGGMTSPLNGADLVLKTLDVKGGVELARILAGYDFQFTAAPVAMNADAQIGKVSVGGDWFATSLVAGVDDGADNFFGTADDAKIAGGDANIVSRIGSVTIKGQAQGTPTGGDNFGIVAEQVGPVKVGKFTETLPTDDIDAKPLGATSDDFVLRNDVLADNADLPTFTGGDDLTIVSPTMATWTDVDGDTVTLKVTKPILDLGDFVRVTVGAGIQVQRLNFSDDDPAMTNGLGITLTAKPTDGDGDGFVNLGFLDATGRDLGAVSIAGDLGRIVAGDNDIPNTAVKSLSVQSIGRFGTSTQAAGATLTSVLDGVLSSFTIRGDFVGANFSTDAGISSLKIGGSILGGAGTNSGVISSSAIGKVAVGGSIIGGAGVGSGRIVSGLGIDAVTVGGSIIGNGPVSGRIETSAALPGSGDLGPVKIGIDIRGGAGDRSGAVVSLGDLRGITVGGSLVGGAGNSTNDGQIHAAGDIATVKIARDVLGNTGQRSAQIKAVGKIAGVTVGGSVLGGTGEDSAGLVAGSDFGPVKIGGDLIGSGQESAEIFSPTTIKGVTIAGSVIGGSGDFNTLIQASDSLGPVKIGRDVIGGVGDSSAQIFSPDAVMSVAIGGSLIGGAGDFSGGVFSDGTMGAVTVGRDVRGGAGDQSGSIEANDRLASVAIGGSVFSAAGPFSGSIMSDDDILSVTIKGSLFGTAMSPVIISGEDAQNPTATTNIALGKITIGGSARFAEIRAGYDDDVLEEPGAQIGSVTVGGDWIASSIGASVVSTNAFLGDPDDTAFAGAPPGLLSKIASILIKGQLLGTAGGMDHFGFVAQQIGTLKIGAVSHPLAAGTDIIALGATGDFFAREVV